MLTALLTWQVWKLHRQNLSWTHFKSPETLQQTNSPNIHHIRTLKYLILSQNPQAISISRHWIFQHVQVESWSMILLVVTHAAYGRHLLFSLKKPTANSWAFFTSTTRQNLEPEKATSRQEMEIDYEALPFLSAWFLKEWYMWHIAFDMYACLSLYMYIMYVISRFQHMASSKRSHFARPDHTISYFTSVTVILQEFCIVCHYHMLVHAPQVLSKAPSQTTTKHAKTHIKSANDADSSLRWAIKATTYIINHD